jgi:hypothetical protein
MSVTHNRPTIRCLISLLTEPVAFFSRPLPADTPISLAWSLLSQTDRGLQIVFSVWLVMRRSGSPAGVHLSWLVTPPTGLRRRIFRVPHTKLPGPATFITANYIATTVMLTGFSRVPRVHPISTTSCRSGAYADDLANKTRKRGKFGHTSKTPIAMDLPRIVGRRYIHGHRYRRFEFIGPSRLGLGHRNPSRSATPAWSAGNTLYLATASPFTTRPDVQRVAAISGTFVDGPASLRERAMGKSFPLRPASASP